MNKTEWTKDRPVEDGWYWIKDKDNNERKELAFFDKKTGKSFQPGFSGREKIDAKYIAEWLGPLTPPE